MSFNEAFWRWFGKSKVVDGNGHPKVMYHGGRFDESDPDGIGVWGLGAHFGTERAAVTRALNQHVDEEIAGTTFYEEDGRVFLDDDMWPQQPGNGFKDEDSAKTWMAGEMSQWEAPDDVQLTAAYLRIENPLTMPDMGLWQFQAMVTELRKKNTITAADADRIYAAWNRSDDRGYNALKAILRRRGYDGIRYKNKVEDPGSWSYIIFKANQAKSVNNKGTWSLRNKSMMNPRRRKQKNPHLPWSNFMRVWARDMKVSCLVTMSPSMFLYLTTQHGIHQEDIERQAHSIEQYTEWAGDMLPIFLKVSLKGDKDGKVIGHEGRHRAAAMKASGETSIPVCIILADENGVADRELNAGDLPRWWIPELWSHQRRISRKVKHITDVVKDIIVPDVQETGIKKKDVEKYGLVMSNPGKKTKTFTFIRLYSYKKMAYIDYRKHPTRKGYVTRQRFEGDGRQWGPVGRKSVIKSAAATKEIRRLEVTGLWKITQTNPQTLNLLKMHNEFNFRGIKIIQSGTDIFIPDFDYYEHFHMMPEAEGFATALRYGADLEYQHNNVRPKESALLVALSNMIDDPDYYCTDPGTPLSNPGTVKTVEPYTGDLKTLTNAWLSPKGVWFKVPYRKHAEKAQQLDSTERQLEMAHWLKLRDNVWHIGLKMLRPTKLQMNAIFEWQLSHNLSDKALLRQSPDLAEVCNRHGLLSNPNKTIRPGTDYFIKATQMRKIQEEVYNRTGRWFSPAQILQTLRDIEVQERRKGIRVVK